MIAFVLLRPYQLDYYSTSPHFLEHSTVIQMHKGDKYEELNNNNNTKRLPDAYLVTGSSKTDKLNCNPTIPREGVIWTRNLLETCCIVGCPSKLDIRTGKRQADNNGLPRDTAHHRTERCFYKETLATKIPHKVKRSCWASNTEEWAGHDHRPEISHGSILASSSRQENKSQNTEDRVNISKVAERAESFASALLLAIG